MNGENERGECELSRPLVGGRPMVAIKPVVGGWSCVGFGRSDLRWLRDTSDVLVGRRASGRGSALNGLWSSSCD